MYKVYLDYLTLKEGNNWLFNRLLCSDLSFSSDFELYITLKDEKRFSTLKHNFVREKVVMRLRVNVKY